MAELAREFCLKNRVHSRFHFQIAILTIAFTLSTVSGYSQPPVAGADSQAAKTSGGKGTTAATTVPGLPPCPPAGSPMLQPSSSTGHHKVMLSWNASVSATGSADNPVGYCLYRSKTQSAAKKNPTCSDCEQVNPTPVVGTGCLDDLVEDGAAYYYVVTAITDKGNPSSSSNETPAVIPANQSASTSSANTYPLCRAPASSK